MMKLRNLRIRQFHWIVAVVAVIGLVGAIFLFFVSEKNGEARMVERLKSRELIVARAGALSISDFFHHRKEKLLLLALIEPIKAQAENPGREIIREVINELKDKPLAGIGRVDKEGILVWSENADRVKVEENIDVSDRIYFLWAKKQKQPGEVFISEPIIARSGIVKGKLVVVMATPVFYQDNFNGIVFISFPVDDLTKRFVSPLASSSGFEAMIIAQNGTILASADSTRIGKEISSYIGSFSQDEQQTYKSAINHSLEGNEVSLVRSSLTDLSKSDGRMITAYSPIILDGQPWSLWVSVPYEEAASLFFPLRQSLVSLLLFSFSGFVILIFLFVWGIRAAQRDGFLDGYVRGKKGSNV